MMCSEADAVSVLFDIAEKSREGIDAAVNSSGNYGVAISGQGRSLAVG